MQISLWVYWIWELGFASQLLDRHLIIIWATQSEYSNPVNQTFVHHCFERCPLYLTQILQETNSFLLSSGVYCKDHFILLLQQHNHHTETVFLGFASNTTISFARKTTIGKNESDLMLELHRFSIWLKMFSFGLFKVFILYHIFHTVQ